MTTRLSGRYLILDIPFELNLRSGPCGELVQVVDFDPVRNIWYAPVDLDDPWLLSQDGLRPSEGDPRSHQQVVYAVAMSVIERFERFTGRRFRWKSDQTLRLVPHAFEGQNAYFDSHLRSIMFGYYRAHKKRPGENIPSQVMFTCLSNDIIAHEVAHAILHRHRKRFVELSNPDVGAWHEAVADLIAFFQHFTHREVVREAVALTSGDLRLNAGLLDLAREFGVASGRGAALRTAVGQPDDAAKFEESVQPHERGAVFVAAVFDAYLASYQAGIADLLRIATGGSGVLPAGSLHPDLVAHISNVAVELADKILGIVIRAFDYLPAVDVTFGDVVRAIVTADRSVYPDDGLLLRSRLVEAFRQRGIVPNRVASLTDESLVWPTPTTPLDLSGVQGIDLPGLILSGTMDLDPEGQAGAINGKLAGNLAGSVKYWAKAHASELGLDASLPIELDGIHVAFRRSSDHLPRPEIVIQVTQRRTDLENKLLQKNERPVFRAGTTIIARVDGRVEHIISKPLPPPISPQGRTVAKWCAELQHQAERRQRDMQSWYSQLEDDDGLMPWRPESSIGRLNFSEMHFAAMENHNDR